ncbi:MAG: nucleotide exchange factor GrpE [Bacteroidota bacterium]
MKEEVKDKAPKKGKNQKNQPQVEEQKKDVSPAEEAGVEEQVDLENEENEEEIASVDDAMKVIANLQLDLRNARQEADESQNQVLRLQADFENFRKRKTKEQADAIRFANQELLQQLLPILDNFDRTLSAIEKTDNLSAIQEGINIVNNNMRKQLKKVGLEPIESIGQEFDSEIHEAISSVPVEDDKKKGIVIDEVEKGYRLKEKVIRFSKVIVGE